MKANKMAEPVNIESLRTLTALMAEDKVLWDQFRDVHVAYVQQALRYLTHYIEGEWTFKQAHDALREMQS